jgi:hypothetical protein
MGDRGTSDRTGGGGGLDRRIAVVPAVFLEEIAE